MSEYFNIQQTNVAALVTSAAIEAFAINNFTFIEYIGLYFDKKSKYFFKQVGISMIFSIIMLHKY